MRKSNDQKRNTKERKMQENIVQGGGSTVDNNRGIVAIHCWCNRNGTSAEAKVVAQLSSSRKKEDEKEK